jgi:hydroxyacylglutathione hydrolase
MLLRPFLYNPTACASYLFGCGSHAKLAVVDPHAELVDDYLATAAALGARIVAVFRPRRAPHGDVVELGNTVVSAIATPGHAPAHHAYAVADRRRGTEEPWLVFTGDSLLIGDVGRPDLHVDGDVEGQARLLQQSLRRLLELPDHVIVYPSHYGGSVCGRALSGNPISSIGFERTHNRMLAIAEPDDFAAALLADRPPAPADQQEIVAANRSGVVSTFA